MHLSTVPAIPVAWALACPRCGRSRIVTCPPAADDDDFAVWREDGGMVARIRCCKAADEFRIALAFTALPETPRKARA